MVERDWWVYILQCADGSLYTGVTTNVDRRLRQHNGTLSGGARYTRARRPVDVVYQELCADRSLAMRREHAIKRLSRLQKCCLVREGASIDNEHS